MMKINDHYMNLASNYLFADIAKKVQAFKAENPEADVISLGIGDVTQPLCSAVVEALHKAADEMGQSATFRGYGPERGYDFLRNAIVEHDYRSRGIDIDADEVFVSDGAKSDTGNFQELLGKDNIIAVTDPVYPVYVDSNVMAGRKIVKQPCTAENGFVPELPKEHVDVIYLCYPNNPTGTTLSYKELYRWVEYALQNNALILYDAAYEAYIRHDNVPHSIYEIDGAMECAVEFHSYSKTAGFTGIRCGYTVVPKTLPVPLNQLWSRRQCTKFNGTSYISQRAAEAIYTPEGQQQIRATIGYYMKNASSMKEALRAIGIQVYGGDDAPYLWVRTPYGLSSWQFFERLLTEAHVVCTPGVGFGPSGEGFVRLTAFGQSERTKEALERIKQIF
ncbi:MAG: LL-diaminopimelate aminotransferase [Bacteroidaceae bacterium]|nr:LL-diaminopimelate aminotransferase [Bacteroidaceae bacterium]